MRRSGINAWRLQYLRQEDDLRDPWRSIGAAAEGILSLQQRGKTLCFPVGQQERVVDSVEAAIRRPNPAVCVAVDCARAALDFDNHQSGGPEHEQIDLVDPTLIVHKFEVRPCVPGTVIRQVLAEELQSLAFPLVCGGTNNCPTRRLHSLSVLMTPSGPPGGCPKSSVEDEQVPIMSLPDEGLPQTRTSE